MTPVEAPAILLSVRDVTRRFGATQALAGADLDVRDREIHGVIGASGAGKSTLLNIIAGLDRYDDGAIVFRGFAIKLRNRRDGVRVGIAEVAQVPLLMPDLTVYDNIVLSAERSTRAAPADLRKRVASLLAAFAPDEWLPLDAKAYRLSFAQTRLVGIARALVARAKLYLFDDPFASLAPREIDGLIGVMMRLRMAGCGLIVAARRLDDIAPVADQMTALTEGRTVLAANPHRDEDLQRMRRAVGALEAGAASRARVHASTTVVPQLTVHRLAVKPTVVEATCTVRAGEIVALHGLEASGCTALLEAVSGLRRWTGGRVDIGGVALKAGDVRAAVRSGVSFVGSDHPLLLPRSSGGDNLRLWAGRAPDAASWPIADLCLSLKLPAESLRAPAGLQPMGVRQRIAIAGALMAGHKAVVLDDPTRGLAPLERSAVHATLDAAAARGCAILLSCSDREEALAVADRCLVLRDGRTIADLPTALLDGEALTLLASPLAAMARNTAVLAELTRENGGAAFWALLRGTHVVCLNAAIADAAADPGLCAASVARLDSTQIGAALARGESDFVTEPDGSRATVLVPIHTRRGRALGWIGLTLGPKVKPPPSAAIAFRVETLAATL